LFWKNLILEATLKGHDGVIRNGATNNACHKVLYRDES
jgi:hypothetical protein